MHDIHEGLAIALGTLAVLHALAALHHHYRRRDEVLRRMLPWGGA
jgi:cytochrome b561